MLLRMWIFIGCFLAGTGGMAAEWFPFMVTGEAISQRWTPTSSPKPAGATGQIRVVGDHFEDTKGTPVRFWGVNLAFQSNFPSKEDAPALAQRMAALGINGVRLHFLDTEIWGKNKPQTQTKIDPEMLDRLDWFIWQLKHAGIYVNFNLHVGRQLDERDGFPDSPKRPLFDKGIDNFEPRMIELQKEYAKELLTHVNPYTNLPYTRDPCVAQVEINNENSVVASWYWGDLDTKLPPFYEKTLEKLWNDWLAKKYSSTEALRQAWECRDFPIGKDLVPDGTFEKEEIYRKAPWRLEKNRESVASCERDEENQLLRITVEKQDKNTWNPQFYLHHATLQKGVPYRISFRMRASQEQKLTFISIQNHAPWEKLGIEQSFDVTPQWQTFTFFFVPKADETNARLGFSRLAKGWYELDDFSVLPGGSLGIAPEFRLEEKNVGIVRFADGRTTRQQRYDFLCFLMDLEERYWLGIYDFLKKDLNVQAPVAGTQMRYGSHYAQAKLDYCDVHAYWCHPWFPNKAWDHHDWIIRNASIVNVLPLQPGLASIVSHRVLGKPYIVSEYNHPFPNQYASEGFPILAAIGGFQNWNGLFGYTWAHNAKHENHGFFDLSQNSVHLVHYPACYNLFVRGDVQSGLQENLPQTVYELGVAQEREIYANARGTYHRSLDELGIQHRFSLLQYTGLRLTDLDLPHPATAQSAAFVEKDHPYDSCTKTRSSTGELIWNAEVPGKGYFLVDTPQTKVFTGFVAGRSFAYHDGTVIQPGKTELDWTTISLTRTGKNTFLLAATGGMKNTGMALRPYAQEEVADTEDLASLEGKEVTSAKSQGTLPRRCEGIAAKVILPISVGEKVVYYPLDGSGKRQNALTAKSLTETTVEIEISPSYQTLWYEVEMNSNG
ncbi:MAG: carbohydrate binding domain-containing protein [Planctomycetia bacterium]|nr:carbohydrate binding domain-containing protein [Planctomycetia bacterium]